MHRFFNIKKLIWLPIDCSLLVVLQLEIWEKVNTEKLREDLQKLLDKGIQSLAVVLLHSYTWVSVRASLTLHDTNTLLSTHESY